MWYGCGQHHHNCGGINTHLGFATGVCCNRLATLEEEEEGACGSSTQQYCWDAYISLSLLSLHQCCWDMSGTAAWCFCCEKEVNMVENAGYLEPLPPPQLSQSDSLYLFAIVLSWICRVVATEIYSANQSYRNFELKYLKINCSYVSGGA